MRYSGDRPICCRLATARCLLEEGANVAICARGAERLEKVRADFAGEFGEDRVLAKAFSVLDRAEVDAFAAEVNDRFGGCDVLITNAGQGRVSTFADTSAGENMSSFIRVTQNVVASTVRPSSSVNRT